MQINNGKTRRIAAALIAAVGATGLASLSDAQDDPPDTAPVRPSDVAPYFARYVSLQQGGVAPVDATDLESIRGLSRDDELPRENVRVAYASSDLRVVVAIVDERRQCVGFRDPLGRAGGGCFSANPERQTAPRVLLQSVDEDIYRAVALIPDGVKNLVVEREGGTTRLTARGNAAQALVVSRPVAYSWVDAQGVDHRLEVTAP